LPLGRDGGARRSKCASDSTKFLSRLSKIAKVDGFASVLIGVFTAAIDTSKTVFERSVSALVSVANFAVQFLFGAAVATIGTGIKAAILFAVLAVLISLFFIWLEAFLIGRFGTRRHFA
jgi:hypothetical protein